VFRIFGHLIYHDNRMSLLLRIKKIRMLAASMYHSYLTVIIWTTIPQRHASDFYVQRIFL